MSHTDGTSGSPPGAEHTPARAAASGDRSAGKDPDPASDPPKDGEKSTGIFGALASVFGALPTFTAAAAALLAILGLVGVGTDALPRVALNAPFALAASFALIVLLLVFSAAFAQVGGGASRGTVKRLLAGTLVGGPLAFLMLMATWVSTEGTTPDVAVALAAAPDQPNTPATEASPVHYTYTASVDVDRVQADEIVEIWLWPATLADCETANLPLSDEAEKADEKPQDPVSPDMVRVSRTGAASNGSLDRTFEGHVILEPDEGLCVAADLPGRCGWKLPVICVLGRDERNAHAFAFPDPPPVPAAPSTTPPAAPVAALPPAAEPSLMPAASPGDCPDH